MMTQQVEASEPKTADAAAADEAARRRRGRSVALAWVLVAVVVLFYVVSVVKGPGIVTQRPL